MLHVTDALKLSGLLSTEWMTDEGRARGLAVHAACEYLDGADLDESTVAPELAPYLEAYARWKLEMRPEILTIEEAVTHPGYGYCGRVDRTITLGGRFAVLDIKSGQPSLADGPQLAAYAGCYLGRAPRRLNLYLSDDGKYRQVERDGRDDWRVWLAALTLANYKKGGR